jgi:zinc protease
MIDKRFPSRRVLAFFLIFLGLGAGCSSARFASSEDREAAKALGINVKLEKRRLSNGLTVILVEDHTVPVVSYQTWFRVGSVDEHPGITGISHLFEHMMFKGTPKYGPKEFFQQLEAKGAEVNAFTTRDYTVYHETFVPTLLEKVIEMESDRMANLKLNDENLNSERLVVLEERRLRTDNTPEGKMDEAIWALAYQTHPYHWPVIGYPQDVLSLKVPEVVEYFKAHYQPENASIVVVGDIDAQATFELIKKYYAAVPAQPKPKRDILPEPGQNEERRLVIHDHAASEKFMWAYHVSAAENDDSYALDVLANILFAGTSSRAYQDLVEKRELMMGVSGSAFTPAYPGLFMISGTMRQGLRSSEAEVALEGLIRKLQDEGVTSDEVRIAVKQLTVQMVDSVRTPHGLGIMIGTVHTIFGDSRGFADDLAKYLKVTPADVKRVALKYLIPNNRSVVVLEPKMEAKE